MEFIDGADSYAYVNLVMPQNWDLGTIKYKYYHFRENDESTPECKTVAFDMAGVSLSNTDVLGGTAWGTLIQVIDTFNCATAENRLMIGNQSAALTIAGTPADFDLISLRMMRDDSAGTMTGSAYMIGVMIEYTIDAETSTG